MLNNIFYWSVISVWGMESSEDDFVDSVGSITSNSSHDASLPFVSKLSTLIFSSNFGTDTIGSWNLTCEVVASDDVSWLSVPSSHSTLT